MNLFLSTLSIVLFLTSCMNTQNREDNNKTVDLVKIRKTLLDFQSLILPLPKHSVLKDPDYYIWGASMVRASDGVCYLFYSRWPKNKGFAGWLDYSEIACATASEPGGPYQFHEVILKGSGEGNWNEQSAHNPSVKKFGDKYYLYFISHTNRDLGKDSERENHRWGQRIGVAIAGHPKGPWTVLDEPIIDYQEGKGAYGYMVNPSVEQTPEGSYVMIFKTRSKKRGLKKKLIQCIATAPTPEGPYTIAKDPILTEASAEDPYMWYAKDRFYAILDDHLGHYTGTEGLALFESENATDWKASEYPLVSKPEIKWDDGKITPLRFLERPQVWLDDEGNPKMLFCAAMSGSETDTANLSFNVHIPLKKQTP